MTPENVAARAAALVALARTWANQTAASLNTTPATRSPPLPVLLPWGGDFRWQNASFWYGNMTTVIAYINSHPDTLGASCSFATAREYFAARDAYLAKQGHTPASALPPLRDTPFAPYDGRNEADAGGAAWTGIYSSRANLKQQLRRLERLLRASDLLAALAALHRPRAALPPGTLSALTTARQTVALLQHHDAVPGTANSARYTGSDPIHGGLVVQDYADRLAASLSQLQPLSAALASLLAGGEADSAEATWEPVLDAHTNTRPLLPARRNSAVLVFNPTPRNLTTTVLVPAEQLGGVSVRLRGSSSPVPHQWLPPSVPTSPTSPLSPTPSPPSPPQLAILATLPPWGSAVYDVSLSSTPSTPPTPPSDRRSSPPRLQGACLDVLLNATDGSLARLAARLDNGTVVELALAAAPHVYTNTSSGAYAFHPTAAARPVPETPHWQVTADGPLLTLVTRSYPEHGLNSTLTLHKHAEDALCGTLELAVGTAPLANMTELIWRLQTDLRSDGVLWADNGLAATSSRRNTSRPIEYNYWPAVRGAALADGNTNVGGGSSRRRLEVLLPHTHGVASLADGQLEVMIQRNVWSLDGEGPAGNDTKSMLARLVLLPGLAESSSSENHTKGLDVHAAVGDPPLVFVQTSIPTGPSNSSASAVSGFAGLRRALPAGLRWQAMRLVSNISSEGSITVLLRFVNGWSVLSFVVVVGRGGNWFLSSWPSYHTDAEREDEEVAVDVAAVLPAGVRVVQLVETLASGQQPINNNNTAASAASSANTLVTLPPKAFRTFHAVLEAATTASIASTQPQRPEPLRQPF